MNYVNKELQSVKVGLGQQINLDFHYDGEHPSIHPIKPNEWIQTFTGKKFYPLNPTYESIDIEDIANSLSMQCRFTGHCKFHYSVAYHSVLVSYICPPEEQLMGLLHDASEAYISDINSPTKRTDMLSGYRKIEAKIQRTIYNKFGLYHEESLSVKKADAIIFATEVECLLSVKHPDFSTKETPLPMIIKEISPKEAKDLFLNRFKELYGK